MQVETITVAKVYKSNGKGPATVVDANNNKWDFWPESKYGKPIPVETFQEGETYVVGFKAGQYNGKEQRTIQSVINDQTRPAKTAAAPARTPTRMKADPSEVESMCVWSLFCALVSGNSDRLLVSLEDLYDEAKTFYAKVRGNPKKAEVEEAFNDAIPY